MPKRNDLSVQQKIMETSATDTKKARQSRVLQTSCPAISLEEALAVPMAIKDSFAGQATDPLLIAAACGIKPGSSNWRTLSGAAAAYGLTDGAYNSQRISLTSLGERAIAPLIEGDDKVAQKEAVMQPTVLAEFYKQYNRNKLPSSEIARNVLQKNGVPADRLESVWDIIKTNAIMTGILKVISGSEYIYLDHVRDASNTPEDDRTTTDTEESDNNTSVPSEILRKMNIAPPPVDGVQNVINKEKPNVFISHGKENAVIVDQLKELLSYGQMEPIISVEREKTAIPVPDKVFNDMRICDAGIIHIDLEEVPHGDGDQKNRRINENVLIEIGAAIALYGKRVVLLCKKGTSLPTNLQGLYRCEYDGSQLDYASTIKLLKTMQELRAIM